MLLFVPIKNLRYLYGYNLQLNNSSLFSVFNISFGYLAIPLLIFVVMTVISKKSSVSVPMRIKRFVIYDLTYAWVVANGFLLAYGTRDQIAKHRWTHSVGDARALRRIGI